MSEKPFENWRILNVRQGRGRDILRQLLCEVGEPSASAEYLFNYLLKPAKGKKLSLCRSVIIEHNYFDQDFVDSVSTFYARDFRKVDKLCRRLHFFSSKVLASDVTDFSTLGKLQDHYLGFCVLRSLETRILGRTAIKPRREKPGVEFHTCCAAVPANVAGSALSAEAAPFMEQDGRVQTCSSVAIWTSSMVMAHCYDYPKYTTSQIMEYATRTIVGARVGPTQGLTYEQIMQALKVMGYEPVIFGETDPFEARNEIYCYVESAIPPILLLALPGGGYHAVTALGHDHSRPLSTAVQITFKQRGQTLLKYCRSSDWVPYFYIHDDQKGVYEKMEFLTPQPTTIRTRITNNQRNAGLPVNIKANLNSWHCPIAIENDSTIPHVPKETIANLWGVIVPLPTGVRLTHSEAENKAINLIHRCSSKLRLKLPMDLVIRPYLIPSNQYKLWLENRNDMSDFVRSFYRGKPMPKWLWVFEMSTAALMNRKRIRDIKIRGELIIDASSNPWAIDFLAFHWVDKKYQGFLFTMSQDDADIRDALKIRWTGPDNQYRPMTR